MTTNRPERLDDALIRPGRVDMKIRFTLATREQIKGAFRPHVFSGHGGALQTLYPCYIDNGYCGESESSIMALDCSGC